uniref:Uncharacterized protein n=1 Tax=Rhipicephalus appendiculatus TaxID=34631 RepID=A0A131YG93_RHIAP
MFGKLSLSARWDVPVSSFIHTTSTKSISRVMFNCSRDSSTAHLLQCNILTVNNLLRFTLMMSRHEQVSVIYLFCLQISYWVLMRSILNNYHVNVVFCVCTCAESYIGPHNVQS